MINTNSAEVCSGCPVLGGNRWNLFEECPSNQACVELRNAVWDEQIDRANLAFFGEVSVDELIATAGAIN
jgi:hypothetical protein